MTSSIYVIEYVCLNLDRSHVGSMLEMTNINQYNLDVIYNDNNASILISC